MEQYLNKLIEQYKQATGSKNADINSKEFSEWVKERELTGIKYTLFLEYLKVRFKDNDCCEIGKGEYDSIIKPYDTLMITSATPVNEVDPIRVIDGRLSILKGTPILIRHKNNCYFADYIPSDIISTYMTQNPFNDGDVANWEDLHNSGESNIVIGIYGKTYDLDRMDKIRRMMDFQQKLSNYDYNEDYSVLGDDYYFAIGTNSYVRERKPNKNRLNFK